MAKKMKMKLLPSFFKSTGGGGVVGASEHHAHHPWQFYIPSCNHPKTLSFRAHGNGGDDIFKTVNSVFFDPGANVETPESWFTNSNSECASLSTESEEFDGESLETVVRGARSERLFFEPGDTSSILDDKAREEEMAAAGGGCGGGRGGENRGSRGGFDPYKESLVLAMDSEDPYEDFRRSMKEMVECHGLKDWECLEELLGWYLKVNGKSNHGFIVGAFVDLLVSLSLASSNNTNHNHINDHNHNHNHDHNNNNGLSSTTSTTTIVGSTSFSSAISSFCSSSSSPSSPLMHDHHQSEVEIDNHEQDGDHSTS